MVPPWANDSNASLLTDLYELTMLQSYFDAAMNETAVFDLFVRRLPPQRNYLIACGLEHVLRYLETFSFDQEAIEYLRTLGQFSEPFLRSLSRFRFTGDVYAMREGTAFFANEPILEIVAPLPEAQIAETFVLNQIQMATLAASKASRVVRAARGRSVVDFGVRAMHGTDAGIKQPRAFYIAGVDSTSSVLAGQVWGIPVSGTMAHSYILAFPDELAAFRQFVRTYPRSILLIDTFSVEKGIQNVINLMREIGGESRVTGVRLDSGDLVQQAFAVRQQLDTAGLHEVKIYASSSLDEYEIEKIVDASVPIDGFGVGRNMASSSDVPVLDTVYKLTQYAGQPKMKFSESKSTLPGRKQVFRERRRMGSFETSLVSSMRTGSPVNLYWSRSWRTAGGWSHPRSIQSCRDRCKAEVEALPPHLSELSKTSPEYRAEVSSGVAKTIDTIRKKM